MTFLFDVDLLVAMAWRSHAHHGAAQAWFHREAGRAFATCPLTETGFIRISSNPMVVQASVTPKDAASMLRRIRSVAGHAFWPDDVVAADLPVFTDGHVKGHRQVTDAYLVSLARHHAGRLATFDHRLSAHLPADLRSAVEAVPFE